PGGLLAVVDDVPSNDVSPDDLDFLQFRAGWSCPAIANERELHAALRAAGLSVEHEEDLTPLVSLRDAATLEQLVRMNRRWSGLLAVTPARPLMESLYGGLMLERLYQRRLARYRFIVARRAA